MTLQKNRSMVLCGGMAKERPHPSPTIVTAHNGGIPALVKTLAVQNALRRVNALHPGVTGLTH